MDTARSFQRAARERETTFVVCHTDAHGGNVMRGAAGELWMIDWETARLVPPEHDLWMLHARLPAVLSAYEAALGHSVSPDLELLGFYLYRRVLEDLAVDVNMILNENTRDEEDRASAQPPPRVAGVLGGLGQEATLDFYAKVLSLTSATRDQDHLHLLIDSNPGVPNRNEAVAGTGPSPGPALAAMAAGLERAGADFLVMVCNAAHAFAPEIGAAVSVPFVSIIDETCDAALRRVPGLKTLGVLGSSGCLDAGLYQDAFAERGVTTLVPEGSERDLFMSLLYRIKAGDKGAEVREAMRTLADSLVAAGAEAIVAGCTEVLLALSRDALPCPLVNSTDVLAERTVFYALHGLRAGYMTPPEHPATR